MNAITRFIMAIVDLFSKIPHSLIAFLARFSIAGVFWKSAQTKIEGLRIDIVQWHWDWGIPRLSDDAIFLFQYEYQLPIINPTLAAGMAAIAEHLFALLLLIGFATRLSAFALIVMTLVIQIFVYPSAWPTHGVWAAVLLYLMAKGPGVFALDRLLRVR